METNNKPDEEAIFANIDKSIKDRMVVYTTESKLSSKKDTDSMRKLIEVSVHEYMIHNPISVKQNTQE